jgi:hypothetical protein
MDSEPEMSTGSCAYCVTRFSVVATYGVTKDRTRQMADGSQRTWSGVAARTFHSGSEGSGPKGNGDSRPKDDAHLEARHVSRFWKHRP